MRKYATADCETDPFVYGRVPKPFVWGFYTENEFQYFYETSEFVEFIKEFEGIIYFHNGGKFDIHFLLEYIEADTKLMIINGRIAKIKIGKAELRDSYLLLPVPLSVYKKDEIDYNKFEKEVRKQHLKEIIEYLKGDCVYLYEILTIQFNEYGQKLTLASSAFDYFHKLELKKKPKTNKFFFSEFKNYYYGGRVQCFKKGIIEKPFKVFDINSAYPFAMLENHAYGAEYEALSKLPVEYEKCFISFIGKSKGALPFREKGKLTFPNDNISRNYKVTGWELKAGLELNCIKIEKIITVYNFSENINFKNYVNHFYSLKSELKGVDDAKYLLVKLYLNSLYGKYAQNPEKHEDFELVEKQYIEGYQNAGYDFEGEIAKFALMSKKIEENRQKYFNVATSASITGFVRAYLFKAIKSAKNVIYCDTDSLVCENFTGIIGKELGNWQHEGNFTKGAFCGKKLYSMKYEGKSESYKNASKGVKLNEKEIFSIAQGKIIEYKNIAPTFNIIKKPVFVVRNIGLT